ncbi:MAG: efflux RND transporter periplasmic adaptor subunit [Syntrophobacteraceae bacterium]
MKRSAVIAIVGLLLVGVSVIFVTSRKGKAVQSTVAPPVAVDVLAPAGTTMERFVEVYGTLSPKNAAEVKSEIPARVSKITVKEWDSVKEEDLLLELDPTDPKLFLSKMEAGWKMARAQLLQAQVDLNRTKREWNRASKLKEGGLVTGQELDERKTALESAEARVILSQAQVAQAESQVAEARHNLDKTSIRAPIQGTVYQRKVDAGDWVDKGGALFSIVDNRVLDFTANVPAVDICQVCEGQVITFTVDGVPDRKFEGVIKRINPMVSSADRTARIQAEVQNSDGVLKGGLYARGRIVVEERKDVIALPKTAVSNWDFNKKSGRIFVIEEGGIARSREVTTGLEEKNMVEVRSGLKPGEKVVVRGGFNLREGDRVSESETVASSGS